MKPVRLLITGSRDWTDEEFIREHLDWYNALEEPITLVHGACPTGADAIADKFAQESGWEIERHPADWQTHGKRAGYIRNAEMVASEPDVFLAFIKNKSRGASMCADLAEKAGIRGARIEI